MSMDWELYAEDWIKVRHMASPFQEIRNELDWEPYAEARRKVRYMAGRQELELRFKRPNVRYATLKSGEIVLLELELADGSFICTPEYFHYMNWPHREEATLCDVWEQPPTIKKGGSGFKYNPDNALEMLDPMNVDAYRDGRW